MGESEPLGEFWEAMLSEEEVRVQLAWSRLSPEEQTSVRSHLRAMADEEGWQPSQRKAARAALRILERGPIR